MEIEPSAQFHLHKYNFCNSAQKLRKSMYQSFLLLPNLAWFPYFVSNVLSSIVCW